MLNFPSTPSLGQSFSGGGSTWLWDGVKWEAELTLFTVTTVNPASGATVVLTVRQPLYVNNAAVLAALTVRLPPSPVPTQYAVLGFRSSVTALTVLTDAGAAIVGSPASVYGPGAAIEMRYVDNIIGWVYWK
jgi:hypothetical protein